MLTKTPLVLLNLWHEKLRTLVAVFGVAFAVVLMLMQLGFLNSVSLTATLMYDELDFDIVLTSRQYQTVSKAGFFPRERLYEAASVPGVRDAHPLYVDFALWLNLQEKPIAGKRQRRGIQAIAFPLEQKPFRIRELSAKRPLLKQRGTVLMDALSKKEFGDWRRQAHVEIAGKQVKIVGDFRMGTGFGPDGDVVMGDQTFQDLFPYRHLNEVSLGLVRTVPGANVDAVCDALRKRLPGDVVPRTRAQIALKERWHWIVGMSIGIIFLLGVVIGFLVGIAIVYQVLASDITDHIAQYATLKAMGYSSGFLKRLILQQALILAVLGFIPGLAISWGLYAAAEEMKQIPMRMRSFGVPGLLPLVVFCLTLTMCFCSGLFALRKVNAADPASLFK